MCFHKFCCCNLFLGRNLRPRTFNKAQRLWIIYTFVRCLPTERSAGINPECLRWILEASPTAVKTKCIVLQSLQPERLRIYLKGHKVCTHPVGELHLMIMAKGLSLLKTRLGLFWKQTCTDHTHLISGETLPVPRPWQWWIPKGTPVTALSPVWDLFSSQTSLFCMCHHSRLWWCRHGWK